MQKEIGGYIELLSNGNKEYHKKLLALNLSRNCLLYIIKARKIKKIFIPYFMCDCIEFMKNYCEVEYYKIDNNFVPMIEETMKEDEYIYIVNNYGQFNNLQLNKYKKKYKNIIVDNVQAFFQKPIKNVDTIYSCRKFFGVTDGAYLYTTAKLNEEIGQDSSIDRFKYLLGRAETTANDYFKDFQENEEKLNNEDLKYMSKTTHIMLQNINYKKVKKIRTSNYRCLKRKLSKINKLKLKNIKGPYMYPLYIENADEIRKKLIKNKVYVAKLWPNVLELEKYDINAYNFAKNIIPIPVDQRYNKEDMKYIVEIIKNI